MNRQIVSTFLVALSCCANFAAPASLSGTVTAAVGGQPLESVLVTLHDDLGMPIENEYTGADGIFLFSDLSPGTYFVKTSSTYEYVDELYDDIICDPLCTVGDGSPIIVGEGSEVTAIDFALNRLGRIEGYVVDSATGAPLVNHEVQAWDETPFRQRLAWTDEQGVYELRALEPGTFTVLTAEGGDHLDELYDDLPCTLPAGCDPTTGTPVPVSLDTLVSGVDFALDLGGSVSGTVSDAASGDDLQSVAVHVFDASGEEIRYASSGVDGAYSVTGLPTGTYFAVADAREHADELYDDLPCPDWPFQGCDPTTGSPLAVQLGLALNSVDFALLPLGGITGTVLDANTGGPVADASISVVDSSGDPHGISGRSDASGAWVAEFLDAGTYYLTAEADDYAVQLFEGVPCRPWVNGSCDAPARGTPVEVVLNAVTGGADFHLDPLASISGTVRGLPAADPIASCVVEFWDDADNPADSEYTDGTGTYGETRLPPGTYFVSTWCSGWKNEVYHDILCPGGAPEDCKPTSGTPVTLSAGGAATAVSFDLLPEGAIFADGFESGDTDGWSATGE